MKIINTNPMFNFISKALIALITINTSFAIIIIIISACSKPNINNQTVYKESKFIKILKNNIIKYGSISINKKEVNPILN